MSETQARVIVVEDEPQIRRFVGDALRREGCTSIEAASGRQGLDEAAGGQANLVILDLGLPDMDGIDFIRDLRTWSPVPILVLSARSAERDKISALDTGADDYLCKPFGVGELLARVRTLLSRQGQSGEARPQHRFGDVEVDLVHRLVSRAGVEIPLTQIEYRLLVVMLANSDKVLTHRHLIQEVWGPGLTDQGHYLRVYVGRLRQKLEADPTQPQHILTETGVGYRFHS